jgi:hypothetical protein
VDPGQLLLLSPLAIAVAVCARAFARDREPLLGLAIAGLVALALREWLGPARSVLSAWPGETLSAALSEGDLARFGAGLAAHSLAAVSAVALARALHERSRAEFVQWQSMESLRVLSEHLAQPRTEQDLESLLEIGCKRFQLDSGLVVVQRESGVVEVEAAVSLAGSQIALGAHSEAGQSLCAAALASDSPLAVEHASQGPWAANPGGPFEFESFLAIRLLQPDAPARAVCFGARSPRPDRFTGVDKSLLSLLARGIEGRLRPQAAVGDSPALDRPQSQGSPAATSGSGPPVEADAVALDIQLQKLRPAFTQLVGTQTPLTFDLGARGAHTEIAAPSLQRIARALLLHAAAAGPEGEGSLLLETRPAVGPGAAQSAAFVTLVVRREGAQLSADELSALHAGLSPSREHGNRPLPLPRVIRLLQDAGGDLSLESDGSVGGRGVSFTAWLPTTAPSAADSRASADENAQPPAAGAPAPPA